MAYIVVLIMRMKEHVELSSEKKASEGFNPVFPESGGSSPFDVFVSLTYPQNTFHPLRSASLDTFSRN